MKKILALSFFPAFTPPRSGGELRLFHVYRELSRHYHVTLLSSSHHGVPEERVLHGTRFVERRIPKCDRFMAEWQRLDAYASGGDLSAVCVAATGSYGTPLHQAYLEEYQDADFVIHDSPFTVPYDLFIGRDTKPRIYNSYNCESVLFRQLHPDAKSAPLHQIVDDCERKLLLHADLVTYCAEPDLRAFETFIGARLRSTLELPNGLMPPPAIVAPSPRGQRSRAVFVGSAHLPNVEAARYIALELAPALPHVDFDIIGNCLPPGSYPPNVVRHGMVAAETKVDLINGATVGLNPMGSGSGSNLKVLDFFGAAVPVFSTAFGVRGYAVQDGRDCVIAERDSFVAELDRLLLDPQRMARIGKQGKQTLESRYSWASLVLTLHETIEALPPKPAALMDGPYVLAMNDYEPFHSGGGGAVRIQGMQLALDRHQPFIYLCFSDDGHFTLQATGTQSLLIRVPRTAAHEAELAASSTVFWISVADIVAMEHAPRNPLLRALYAVLRKQAITIVADHVYMAGLPLAFHDAFIYSSHNNETVMKRATLQYHPQRDHYVGAVERTESLALQFASMVIAVSEEEAQTFLKGRMSSAPVVVVRNGAPAAALVAAADWQEVEQQVGPRSVAFIGSSHVPNIESCRFIAEHLAPALPDVTFHLIGAAGLALPSPLAANVRVWGSVSDSMRTAILSSCTVAVNPMFSGGGSNIKLADYIGHGLAVVTTPFGRRGYPDTLDPHVTVAEAGSMAAALRTLLDRPRDDEAALRVVRRRLFDAELAMSAMGERYADLVLRSQQPKLHILFVTYRWIWPIRGGGEVALLQHLKALSRSGKFVIDVVAPDVAEIHDIDRYTSVTAPATGLSAPVDMPDVHFRRFPTQAQPEQLRRSLARKAWELTSPFERAVYQGMPAAALLTGLAWGWGSPEGTPPDTGRWAYHSFGLHLSAPGRVTIRGNSLMPVAVLVTDQGGRQLMHIELSQAFGMTFAAPAGEVRFEISATGRIGDDMRPLGLYIQHVAIDDAQLDLTQTALANRMDPDIDARFERLHAASVLTRAEEGLRLTDGRGPHSPQLEAFIEANVDAYDLVLTHNTVFRTALVAIEAARKSKVPVAVLPHAHLDDDYYHFPDVTGMAVAADLVMAVPKAACDFYRRRGAKQVMYMTPGIDTSEVYSAADEQAFRALHPSDQPFILVLGRKSGAKGYRSVIQAVEGLARLHPVEVVLIGPDDDGLPVNSPIAHYMGAQPRQVLRGALRACIALVNMSTSESFGMVLLEAWLARKPVIVNRACAAFLDMAEHGYNALLVEPETLAASIEALYLQPEFAAELGQNGFTTATRFNQPELDAQFVRACMSLCRLTGIQ